MILSTGQVGWAIGYKARSPTGKDVLPRSWGWVYRQPLALAVLQQGWVDAMKQQETLGGLPGYKSLSISPISCS